MLLPPLNATAAATVQALPQRRGLLVTWQPNPANPPTVAYAVLRAAPPATDLGGIHLIALVNGLSGTSFFDATALPGITYQYLVCAQGADNLVSAPCVTLPAALYRIDAILAAFNRDPDGFTIFNAPANAAIIGPGDLPDYPTAQQRALSNGSMAVLYRRGNSFKLSAGGDSIQTNGPSFDRPFQVGATPDVANPRPVLFGRFGLGNAKQPTRNIAVYGLEFYDPSPPGTSGLEAALRMVNSVAGAGSIFLEDLAIHGLQGGLELQDISGTCCMSVAVRRCAIYDCVGERWGLYTQDVYDLLCEDCFFWANGWSGSRTPAAVLNHNVYIQKRGSNAPADPMIQFRGLLSAQAGSHGIQLRPGGMIDGYYSWGNPIAGFVADTASVLANAVVEGGGVDLSIGQGNPRGLGFQSNECDACTFQNVLFVNKSDAVNKLEAINITSSTKQTVFKGVGVVVNGWTGSPLVVQGNPQVSWTAPWDLGQNLAPYADRTLQGYAKFLGYADIPSFLSAALANRRGKFDKRLLASAAVAWVQGGFGLPAPAQV